MKRAVINLIMTIAVVKHSPRRMLVLVCFLVAASLPLSATLSLPKKSNGPRLVTTSFGTHSYDSARDAGISIQMTMSKGLGAFATTLIPAGTRIGAYVGEFLTRSQVEARYWNIRKCKPADRRWLRSRTMRNQGRSGDYLFDMGDDVFMDAGDTDISSWCRFMNHATQDCDECNVETDWTKQVKEGKRVVQQPSLWFVSIKDIQIGEELSYDYGDCYWN